jgi:hypothetical protein
MNGRIWVESVYKKGSTFYLELPRIGAQEATELAEQQAKQIESNTSSTNQPFQEPTISSPTNVDSAPSEPQDTAESAEPASTVPRGESLTKEQIAAHVAELEAMAKEQPSEPTSDTPPAESASTRQPNVSIPVRNSVSPPQ